MLAGKSSGWEWDCGEPRQEGPCPGPSVFPAPAGCAPFPTRAPAGWGQCQGHCIPSITLCYPRESQGAWRRSGNGFQLDPAELLHWSRGRRWDLLSVVAPCRARELLTHEKPAEAILSAVMGPVCAAALLTSPSLLTPNTLMEHRQRDLGPTLLQRLTWENHSLCLSFPMPRGWGSSGVSISVIP